MAACERCHGSGEIGVRNRFTMSREAPGPVPEDARGWVALKCPDCRGSGTVSEPLCEFCGAYSPRSCELRDEMNGACIWEESE